MKSRRDIRTFLLKWVFPSGISHPFKLMSRLQKQLHGFMCTVCKEIYKWSDSFQIQNLLKLKENLPLVLHAWGHFLCGFFFSCIYHNSGKKVLLHLSHRRADVWVGRKKMDVRISTGPPPKKSIKWPVGKNQ